MYHCEEYEGQIFANTNSVNKRIYQPEAGVKITVKAKE